MKITRRQFLKGSAMVGAYLAVGAGGTLFNPRTGHAFAISPAIAKFNTPLRSFGVDIPILTANKALYTGVDYYEVTAGVFRENITGVAGWNTRLYGYQGTGVSPSGQTALGAAIVARKGTPVRIKFNNTLPASHIIPFDGTIAMPGVPAAQLQNRIAIHLHGGLVPWVSDGGPFHWFSPGGAVKGASYVNWLPNGVGTLTNDYYYPNNQSARLMWYHDHAIGTTRTSAYAGLATGYLVTDAFDDIVSGTNPGYYAYGLGEILVFQDKVFWDPAIDPNYAVAPGGGGITGALIGDLWYPYIYEKQIWKLAAGNNAKKGALLPVPSAVAEFFGDTMLANGHVYPYKAVANGTTTGTYRFRLLNACNARFLNLSFVQEDPLVPGEPLLGKNGLPVAAPVDVWQIGTEGGFLNSYVQLFAAGVPSFITPLLLGPAERADILVDFSKCPAGNVILYNDAQAPYPAGNPMFDWFFGVKGVIAGSGPNTRTIMQFRVGAAGAVPGRSFVLPTFNQLPNPVLSTTPDAVNGGLKLGYPPGSTVNFNGETFTYVPTTQELTLNEAFDLYGRLEQLVGTNVLNPITGVGFGRAYLDPPTEVVKYKTIQIWNIYNLTADAHPMHFHLFNVMVLRRRPFRVNQFNGIPIWTGLGVGPDPNETGWKETVKMYPGTCTTVAVLVEDPMPAALYPRDANGRPTVTVNGAFTGTVPVSPRLTSMGITGDEYVWHCHILEHEEHDMMRPLVGGQ